MNYNIESIILNGPAGFIAINKKDKLARKLAMLFENKCLGLKVKEAARKYGFSRPRFYQVKNAFEKGGSEALVEHKKGSHRNYVRTDRVVNQIVRLRFLDPDASIAVITQKLKQAGLNVSQRSVERTITEYGIQKKTPLLKSREGSKES